MCFFVFWCACVSSRPLYSTVDEIEVSDSGLLEGEESVYAFIEPSLVIQVRYYDIKLNCHYRSFFVVCVWFHLIRVCGSVHI